MMNSALDINILFGSISSLLLAVVAYFIKQLHSDFKSMEKDISEVKTMALLIKTEFKNSHDLLNQKVEYMEQRINKIEFNLLKHSENENK